MAKGTTGQSHRMSWSEAIFNVVVGYVVAVAAQVVIFPWFDYNPPMTTHLMISLCFTVVSLIRGYLLRRFFNWLHSVGIN